MGSPPPSLVPQGMYAHATPPPQLPITVAQAQGSYLILVVLLCFLCGANLALYAVYLHLYRGRRRDPVLLQLGVLLSILCNCALAVVGCVCYFDSSLIALYSSRGFDLNAIEWYVPFFHVLQAIGDAIGQTYFALRIAKLFDARRAVTRSLLGVGLAGIGVQFALMVWFGAAFFGIKYKTRLGDASADQRVRGILTAWTTAFVVLELALTSSTVVGLVRLRRQTRMDAARRVIFNLGVYSLHGQALLALFSLTSLWLFARSKPGWYAPVYLLSGALYTLVLLANLLYRQVVASAMQQAQLNPKRGDGTADALRGEPDTGYPAACGSSAESNDHGWNRFTLSAYTSTSPSSVADAFGDRAQIQLAPVSEQDSSHHPCYCDNQPHRKMFVAYL